jgi:hypothetical protein
MKNALILMGNTAGTEWSFNRAYITLLSSFWNLLGFTGIRG